MPIICFCVCLTVTGDGQESPEFVRAKYFFRDLFLVRFLISDESDDVVVVRIVVAAIIVNRLFLLRMAYFISLLFH